VGFDEERGLQKVGGYTKQIGHMLDVAACMKKYEDQLRHQHTLFTRKF
jgi:hypothetical protein